MYDVCYSSTGATYIRGVIILGVELRLIGGVNSQASDKRKGETRVRKVVSKLYSVTQRLTVHGGLILTAPIVSN